QGIILRDVYVGPEGVMTGSARLAQEAREREQATLRSQEAERRTQEFNRRKRQIEAQIEELQAQLSDEQKELARLAANSQAREQQRSDDRDDMSASRMVAPGAQAEYRDDQGSSTSRRSGKR